MAAPPPPPPPGPGGKIGGPPPPPPPSSSSLGGKKSTGKSLSDVLSLAKNRSETADSESSSSRTPAILRGEQAFAPRPEHGHAGLFNQGSTCYMNSLLQALYMTPSFRDALTSWRTGKEIEEKNLSRCIPYQFQRLFARLKFSSKASINTKDITRSFGWEGSDIFQQQDANELRLVLFDALEKSFDHYKTSNVIDTLFRGSVNNVRKCSSCSHEKKTPEPYLDLNLPVRGIGSLEESLSLFLQQEKLEGVLCSECDNRCDADLGIQISSVPTVLTLSLRRFDYDTITWRRVKLGHRVSFPFSLDMSPFITTETKTSSSSSSNEKENYIYELFGVLIHSGGAMGGHYYSFMRDLESGKWLSFDDANVRLISEEDIESAFGTSEGSKGSSITGGGTTTEAGRKPGRRMGCAYMLVYHLRHKIPKKMSSPQYPPDVMSEVKEENSVFEKEKEEYEIRRDTVHLKVFVTGKERERIVGVYNKRTVKEGITEMYKDCAQNDLIDPDLTPQDCVRLRDYNASTNTPGKAYNSSDDRNILQAGFVSMRTFLLEVKGKDEDFPEVQAPQVTIKVRKYNESGDSLDPIIILSLPSDAPLLLLRETLAENKDINIPVAKQRLVRIRENDCSTETIAGCDEMTLESLGIGFAFSVYVESILEGKPSGLLEYLEGQKHIIEIQYSNDTDKQKDQGMKILLIDDRKTIRELKGALSAETGVATNKFLLCRRGLKAEYKNGDLRLCDADIFSGMQLSMIAGQPLGSNQYKFKVFLYNPPKESPKKSEELLPSPPPTTTPSPSPADGSPGGPPPPPSGPPPPPSGPPPPPIGGVAAKSLEFTMLGEAVIDIGMTVDEVRNEMRSQEYGEKVPQFFRLREKLGQQMGQVLKGGALFGSHYKNMRSGMELAVQGLSSDDHLGPEDLLVSARQWLPEDWKLGDRIEEIVLEDTATVQDLKERFSLIFDIPLAFIAIARPGRAISPFQVATANWDPMEDLILTGSPWYMKSGDAIVVKDRRHKDKHEAKQIPVSMMRETGVTITTDFEEQLRLAEQLSLAEQ